MKRKVEHLRWKDLQPGLEIAPINSIEEFDGVALRIGQLILQHHIDYPPRIGFVPATESLSSANGTIPIASRFAGGPNERLSQRYRAFILAPARANDTFRVNGTEQRFAAVIGQNRSYDIVESIVYLRLEKPSGGSPITGVQKEVGNLQHLTALSPYLKSHTEIHHSQPRGATQGVSLDDIGLA